MFLCVVDDIEVMEEFFYFVRELVWFYGVNVIEYWFIVCKVFVGGYEVCEVVVFKLV